MLRKLIMALAVGAGLGAGSTLALADDEKRDYGDSGKVPADQGARDDTGERDDRGRLERGRDRLFGKDARKDERLKVGTLKLSLEDVQKVKQVLIQRGYSFKSSEGKWDKELGESIEKFQKDVGIEKTGDLDIATLNALGFGAIVGIHPDVRGSELARTQFPEVTERPAGMPRDAAVVGSGTGGKEVLGFLLLGQDELENIQEVLKEQGYYHGDANGAFSSEFMDAIRRFQQAKGIQTASGLKVGTLDLATLAWFPKSGIDVKCTEEPETEISEPRGVTPEGGMPK